MCLVYSIYCMCLLSTMFSTCPTGPSRNHAIVSCICFWGLPSNWVVWTMWSLLFEHAGAWQFHAVCFNPYLSSMSHLTMIQRSGLKLNHQLLTRCYLQRIFHVHPSKLVRIPSFDSYLFNTGWVEVWNRSGWTSCSQRSPVADEESRSPGHPRGLVV